MSLSGAMTIAVSGLKSQSSAVTLISNNLANSSTTGYKGSTTSFSNLVTQTSSYTSYSGAGVTSSTRQNVAAQGSIEGTDNSTDLAIDGSGMFVVSYGTDASTKYYTRDGEFDIDNDGYLVLNRNYYLLGWPTDSAGNVEVTESASNLERINVTETSSSVAPTTEVTIDADLGPSSAVGDSYDTSYEVYDSLGNMHTVTASWSKTATNEWDLSFSYVDASGSTQTITPATALVFNGSGQLTSPTAPAAVSIAWGNGSDTTAFEVDLSGVTQTKSAAGVSQSSWDADGHSSGTLSSISISDDGTITANYSNGEAISLYKIAVATFPNYDGLIAQSNNVYLESSDSGNATLHEAGADGSGGITASALEASTVDTATEFSKMIVAQQAYTAASQVISTAKDMYDTLTGVMR